MTIEQRFQIFRKSNDELKKYWSDFTCFAEAICSQDYEIEEIEDAFDKLVDESEYKKGEKEELLNYLMEINLKI